MDWRAAVLDALDDRARARAPLTLGIDGPDCAGKTTLADAVVESLGTRASRLCADDFLNPPEIRYARGDLDPEGCYRDSFDHAALLAAVASWRQAAERRPADVLVVDGVFLLRPELRELWDVAVYLDVPPAVLLARAVARDALRFGGEAGVRARYRARYLPAHRIYLDEADPTAVADLVLRDERVSNRSRSAAGGGASE